MRGIVYIELEQYDLAIADYSSAIELQPEEIGILFNRGQTYFNLGKCEAADKDLEQYIEKALARMEVSDILTQEKLC